MQLSYALFQFKDEFLQHIKNIHQILDTNIANYYNSIEISVNKDEFTTMILMFLESWYLNVASFIDMEQ